MAAAKSRTGFMSLSAELRSRIYELVLISTEIDSEHVDSRNDTEHSSGNEPYVFYKKPTICIQQAVANKNIECGCLVFYGWRSKLSLQPALTRVCRQVRQESLPIYYAQNEFVAYSGGESSGGYLHIGDAQKFLLAIGKKNAARIGRFTVLITDGCINEVDVDEVQEALSQETYGLRLGVLKVYINRESHGEDGEFELLEMSTDEDDGDEEEAMNDDLPKNGEDGEGGSDDNEHGDSKDRQDGQDGQDEEDEEDEHDDED